MKVRQSGLNTEFVDVSKWEITAGYRVINKGEFYSDNES
jgi:hypothetical protein